MSIFDLKSALYNTKAKNNEEYKKELQKRKKVVMALFGMGVLTIAVMVVLCILKPELMESFRGGFYSGVGSGLIAGAIVGYLKLRKIMGSEEELKKARLLETDEREQEITSKALKTSAKVMLAGIYIVLLLCAFLSEETILVMASLVLVFFASFLISRTVYSKIL